MTLLRPGFLLLGLIAMALLWYLRKLQRSSSWQQLLPTVIAEHLLTDADSAKMAVWRPMLLIALLSLAAAGPSLQLPQGQLYRDGSARVLLLNMSYSMRADDVKPDRLELARYKALDLINSWKDGETGLIAFAGDAFVLSPLTHDSNNLANLLPHISPEIMPVHGTNLAAAIEQAKELLLNAGYPGGDIIAISDGFSREQFEQAQQALSGSNLRFSMLAVGTAEGAPIPLEGGALLQDSKGSIVIPRLEQQYFLPLCQQSGGLCQSLRADNLDIQRLSQLGERALSGNEAEGKLIDLRVDLGFWLLIPALLLALWEYLRPSLPLWLLAGVMLLPGYSFAEEAQGSAWWNNQAQRAHSAFEQENYQDAEALFNDPQWQAASAYRAGDYQRAQQLFAQDDSAQGWYNQGNALAMQGETEQAIAAYDQALERDPSLEQAAHNKAVLEQQQSQQSQEQQSQEQQDSGDQGSEQQQDGEQGEGQQSESQQGEEQPGNQQQAQSEQSPPPQPDQEQQGDEQQAQEQAQQQPGEEEGEQQQAEQPAEPTEQEPDEQAQQVPAQANGEGELDDQELQRWLNALPNDPSLLLRNKMYLEYQKRRRQPQSEENW
ncbi:VWA domain-containing protein [Aliagarivorans marinus]|uniref:VWA domain-containing protein n=1 Tax=Aliagarivorans marinus TaxID=561965 RepID=UPI0005560613|nr:VWA domain-containing protein [Aliagarivorans marinus]